MIIRAKIIDPWIMLLTGMTGILTSRIHRAGLSPAFTVAVTFLHEEFCLPRVHIRPIWRGERFRAAG